VFPINPAYFPDGFTELLAYREQRFQATINQLLGDEFAVGALYRVTKSELHRTWPGIPATVPGADLNDEATLQEVSLFCNWNAAAGFFARGEASWYSQRLGGVPSSPASGSPSREGDDFWQLNAFIGYRFKRNRAEVTVGVLNINDADYHLSPLNPYEDIPRERTVLVRCRFSL